MSLNELITDLKGSANVTTHGLKEHGGGSMFDGIVKYVADAYEAGSVQGMCEGKKIGTTAGRIQGMVIASALIATGSSVIYVAKRYKLMKKFVDISKPRFLKELSKTQIMKYALDTDFPWEDVKKKIEDKEYMTDKSFDMWIKPLGCRAYDDRVLVEVNDEKIDCDYISRKYKRIIQECIYEVTGKIYIVSIVRPGEILIEDMD